LYIIIDCYNVNRVYAGVQSEAFLRGRCSHVGKLDGRVAVVTGAGRGIGAAEAIKMAEEGASVAVLDLSAEAGQDTVAAIKKAGGEAVAIACDVSSAKQVGAAFEEVAHRFGRIDIWSTTRGSCGTTCSSR
jgi:3-oxoacyl-[acyl-carrier protein] reductase